MARPVKSHVFNGKRYKIELVPPYKLQHDLGSCDPPDKPNKTIKINNTLTGLEELDTLLHESLHNLFWNVEEEYIEQSATTLASLLYKWGYRKVKESDNHVN